MTLYSKCKYYYLNNFMPYYKVNLIVPFKHIKTTWKANVEKLPACIEYKIPFDACHRQKTKNYLFKFLLPKLAQCSMQ